MPANPLHLRVFLSSPGDVSQERRYVEDVVQELAGDPLFAGRLTVELVSWDRPDGALPMLAGETPQRSVVRFGVRPSECHLTVVVLWGRLGTRLPRDAARADGSIYESGTQWEFEDARAMGRDVMVYHRTQSVALDPTQLEQRQQLEAVHGFMRQFRNADGSLAGGFSEYADVSAFPALFRAQFRSYVGAALEAGVLREPTPQPPLVLPETQSSPENRFVFTSRVMPFTGRAREFAQLRAFLAAESRFSWWAVVGPGGSGKSRLALELALAEQQHWRAGFLPRESRFRSWEEWRPVRPTLIVIDYAGYRAAEAGAIVLALLQNAQDFAHPVRVLFLERLDTPSLGVSDGAEAVPRWMTEVLGTGSRRAQLMVGRFGRPLNLEPLGPSVLSDLLSWLISAGREQVTDDLMQQLRALDLEGRPLYVAFLADAVSHGRSARGWDASTLVQDVLAREIERWRASETTRQDENLLAIATIVGAFPLTRLRGSPVADLLPAPTDYRAARFEALTGRPAKSTVAGLSPELLGEIFVLEKLTPDSELDDSGSRLVEEGFHIDPVVAAGFWIRCSIDFPNHPSLKSLSLIMTEAAVLERIERDAIADQVVADGAGLRLGSIILAAVRAKLTQRAFDVFGVLFRIVDRWRSPSLLNGFKYAVDNMLTTLVMSGQFEAAEAVSGSVWSGISRFLPPNTVAQSQASYCFALVTALVEANAPEQAAQAAAQFRTIVADDPIVDEFKARATINLLIEACRSNETRTAVSLLQDLRILQAARPTHRVLTELLAKALRNVGLLQRKNGEAEPANSLRTELAALADSQPALLSVWEYLQSSDLDLVNAYQRSAPPQLAAARALAVEMIGLAERHPESEKMRESAMDAVFSVISSLRSAKQPKAALASYQELCLRVQRWYGEPGVRGALASAATSVIGCFRDANDLEGCEQAYEWIAEHTRDWPPDLVQDSRLALCAALVVVDHINAELPLASIVRPMAHRLSNPESRALLKQWLSPPAFDVVELRITQTLETLTS